MSNKNSFWSFTTIYATRVLAENITITKTYPWRLDLSKLDWEPKGDLKADIEPVC